MKDFYDLWTLQRKMTFEGATLLEAIIKTFSNRQTKLDMDSINELILFGENEEKTIATFLTPLIKTIDEGIPPP